MVMHRPLVAAAALSVLARGAFAQSALAGCYSLSVGDWAPRLGADSIYYGIPRSITLDSAPKGRGLGFVMKPDMPYPGSSRFPNAPNWRVIGDTLLLVWSNGSTPTVVQMLPQGTELVGEASAMSDTHSIGDPPRSRAKVRARRQSCSGQSVDSLRLKRFLIRVEPTDSCVAEIFTRGKANNQESATGETNIQTRVSPRGLRQWIDSASAYRRRTATAPPGQRLRYAWFPIYGVGIERVVTDRSDSYVFAMTGYALPMSADEIPLLSALFDSAAARTARLSATRKCPPTN